MGAQESGTNSYEVFETINVWNEGVLSNLHILSQDVLAEKTEDKRDFAKKEIPTYKQLLRYWTKTQLIYELSRQLSRNTDNKPTLRSTLEAITRARHPEMKILPYSLAMCLVAKIKYGLVHFPNHKVFHTKQNVYIEKSLTEEEFSQTLITGRSTVLIGSGVLSLGNTETSQGTPMWGPVVPNVLLIRKEDKRRGSRYSIPSGHGLMNYSDVAGLRELDQETNSIFNYLLRFALPLGLQITVSDKVFCNYIWMIYSNDYAKREFREKQKTNPLKTENLLLASDLSFYKNFTFQMEQVLPNSLLFSLPLIYDTFNRSFINTRLNGGRYFSYEKMSYLN